MIRSASTLIVMRSAGAELEVLMARRTGNATFAGGVWVFPGGVIDDVDHTPLAAGLLGPDGADAERAPWLSAAMRETAEEINAFLTVEPPEPDVRAALSGLEGAALLGAMDAAGLVFDTARVAYWANWITPRSQPRRYDTRFFVAEAPAYLSCEPDGSEITDVAWVTPEAALAGRRDTWPMIFPTIRNLRELTRFRHPGEVLESAGTRVVEPVEPAPVTTADGKLRLLIPGDEGYDGALAAQGNT